MASNGSLKRIRSLEEEYDCLPIAKKINNLHLRPSADELNSTSFNQIGDGADVNEAMSVSELNTDSYNNNQNDLYWYQASMSNGSSVSGPQPVVNNIHVDTQANIVYVSPTSFSYNLTQPSEPYDPDLGPRDNPIYYSINEVLYYAHMAKLHRLSVTSSINSLQ